MQAHVYQPFCNIAVAQHFTFLDSTFDSDYFDVDFGL